MPTIKTTVSANRFRKKPNSFLSLPTNQAQTTTSKETYPKSTFILSKRLIYAHRVSGADGYLSCGLVKGDRLKRLLVIVVYGLNNCICVAEDAKSTTCDVYLEEGKARED